MRVESEEQGVRFEWTGEPSGVVRVGLAGDREASYERLALLHEVIRGQREGGVAWTDLEMRERHVRGMTGPLLLWSGDFGDWRTAAMVFTVLCKAVGLDDETVQLRVEP